MRTGVKNIFGVPQKVCDGSGGSGQMRTRPLGKCPCRVPGGWGSGVYEQSWWTLVENTEAVACPRSGGMGQRRNGGPVEW